MNLAFQRLLEHESFFRRDISSAILFCDVEIHFELMPRGDPMLSKPQKNLARRQPMADFLQACMVQFRADILSVTLSTIGHGSSVLCSVVTTV